MTIEKSPPSTEPKPAATSGAKGANSTKEKSGKPEGADPGGFMAILATVDAEAAPAAAAVVDTLASACLGPPDALPVPQVIDPVDISYAQTAMDAAELLAQAAQLLPTAPTSARDISASQMAAQTANPQALNPLGRPAKAPLDVNAAVAVPQNQAADASPLGLRKPYRAQPDLNSMNAQTAAASSAATATGSSAAADARAAQVAAQAGARADTLLTVPTVSPALLAAVVNSVRREDEGREGSAFKPANTEGVMPAASSGPAGGSSPMLASATAQASPADLYVAEQVKYWISNDVKNAEMKLDGIGNNPVEVSISMHGNEAHVAFRSDESQARDVLEAASSHLKDLLQREGLVLSGVSVGTTGSGDANAQQRKEQQGARQARVIAATQSAASQGAVSGARASGRALDLFV